MNIGATKINAAKGLCKYKHNPIIQDAGSDGSKRRIKNKTFGKMCLVFRNEHKMCTHFAFHIYFQPCMET